MILRSSTWGDTVHFFVAVCVCCHISLLALLCFALLCIGCVALLASASASALALASLCFACFFPIRLCLWVLTYCCKGIEYLVDKVPGDRGSLERVLEEKQTFEDGLADFFVVEKSKHLKMALSICFC